MAVEDAVAAPSPSPSPAPEGPTQRFFLRGIEKLGEHHLQDYFQKFGVVTEVTLLRDKKTQRPRGMGFVALAVRKADDDAPEGEEDPEAALAALTERITEDSHSINGVPVELQEALPKIDDDDRGNAAGATSGAAADGGEGGDDIQAGPAETETAPADEEEQDPAAKAMSEAQMQMHYLAMAINASVPDMAALPANVRQPKAPPGRQGPPGDRAPRIPRGGPYAKSAAPSRSYAF